MTETSDNYSGVDRTYYDTEKTQLKSEVFIYNGKKEGVYKEYYEDGELLSEVNYINGKKNGIYNSYYDNGQLSSEINYIDGKKV
jgi:antitoxin component YwqK of YwqJK toxin-antitoxin module